MYFRRKNKLILIPNSVGVIFMADWKWLTALLIPVSFQAEEHPEIHNRLFSTDILKDENDTTPQKNFKESIKEKYSPKKSIIKHLTEESLKKNGRLYEKKTQCCRSAPSTPRNHRRNIVAKSTSETPSPVHSPFLQRHERLTLFTPPAERTRQAKSEPKGAKPEKYSTKVSRNLMSCYPKDEIEKQQQPNINYNDNHVYSQSLQYPSTSSVTYSNLNATVPLYYEYKFKENHIDDSEGVTSFSSSSSRQDSGEESNEAISSDSFMYQNDDLSDCEKEVESFFIDKLEPPPHSSTPKVNQLRKFTSTPHRLQYSSHVKNESAAAKT